MTEKCSLGNILEINPNTGFCKNNLGEGGEIYSVAGTLIQGMGHAQGCSSSRVLKAFEKYNKISLYGRESDKLNKIQLVLKEIFQPDYEVTKAERDLVSLRNIGIGIYQQGPQSGAEEDAFAVFSQKGLIKRINSQGEEIPDETIYNYLNEFFHITPSRRKSK